MQEESGEAVCQDSSVLVWPCPLCQQERPDRDVLAQHLTEKHSVLPVCLDRLLDTATPVKVVCGDRVENSGTQCVSGDTHSFQQSSETNGAVSDPVENTTGAAQEISTTCMLRSEVKVHSCPEEEIVGEGEKKHVVGSDHLELGQESSQLPESTTAATQKLSLQLTADKDSGIDGTENSTSKTHEDPALEKFHDSSRPFKCNACLESFTSKSALSVHYSSTSHLHRMRTGSSMQSDEKETSSTAPAPYLSRPFFSNKPYQCAVCRVSYNHAFTLESHLKSVLHQTRSRNTVNSTGSTAGASGKKGSVNVGNATNAAINSSSATQLGGAAIPSPTGNGGSLDSLTVLSGSTKDGEQSALGAQAASSPCPHSAPGLSLLSSPVASAQAVSAFLLTSSSSPSLPPSVQPSLLSAAAGGATGMGVPQLELIAQQQLLLPLFLNGLQAQNQGSNPESASTVLTQTVPLLGLSAAQQALLAQRLSAAQNQVPWLTAGLPETKNTCAAEEEDEENSGEMERLKKESDDDEEEEEEGEERDEITQEGERTLGVTSQAMEKQVMKGEDGEESGNTGLNCTLNSENKQSSGDALGAQGTEESGEDSPMEETNCVVQAEGISHSSEMSCDGEGEPDSTDLPVSGETAASIGTGRIESSPRPHTDPNFTNDSTVATNSCAVMLKPGPAQPCRLNSEPSLHSNDVLPAGANAKGQSHTSAPPVLSEFQSQVLWAFLESRSEADAADLPQDDCVALGKEVGLSGQQVRRWLDEARREPRERPKGASGRMTTKMAEEDGVTQDDEMEEGVLTIVEAEEGESPEATRRHAIDLSCGRGRGKERELGKESPGEPCLTSDSDNEGDGFYTSVIVTDEESECGAATEDLRTPAREDVTGEQEEKGRGGKVLRSSTVFLSDAEDTEDEEEDEAESGVPRVKKRKRNRELEREEVDVKKERLDPDVDLELEAQGDPPLPISVDQQSLPNVLHSLPLSISLTPFTTQFINPYVLSIPPSAIGLGIADGDRDRGRASTFPNTAAITTPPPASHVSPVWSLSNGGICESALDLSMGKKHSSISPFPASKGDRTVMQAKPTALGVPGADGLIVVRVKPEGSLAIPTTNNSIASNNNTHTSTVYIRAAERVSASLVEREREKQHEREREKARVREKERDKEQKPTKARRFRDMRRSRTIIQTEQLDVLYGCYFKDPNPGKHEFQQISEWVHLPKKVVQIWFQNMRARERKGEVRFISDGTLAAMGKPLIKFTWPLTLPVFSSSPSPNSSPLSSSGTAGDSAGASPKAAAPKTRPEVEQGKVKEEGQPKESGASSSTSYLSPGVLRMPNLKPKPETQSPVGSVRPVSKAIATSPEVPVVNTRLPSPSSYSSPQKRKRGGGDEKVRMKEEDEFGSRETTGPGVTNRMVPKIPSSPTNKPVSPGSHKRNGLNDWTPKSSFKINTLSREQLGLSTPRPSGTITPSSGAKSSLQEGAYQHHSSSPRRPRTHLTSLQVSIMQSCYETCPHPNALECETIGTELGLPLKVVQIWFQNTRAKEKRWRLQQQKQSPGTTDPNKKVDTSSGSFLLYSALRANRPILPKPVQLTVLEPSTPPANGQPASRETLRGRCDACSVTFESRAAGRTHVFSPHHLATLRSTNFGHPPSLVNSSSAAGSGTGSSVATQSSPSAASSSS